MTPAHARLVVAVALLLTAPVRHVSLSLGAQGDALADARALYEAAAYEDALSALARVAPDRVTAPVARDLHVLRALALLALGREPEAREAIEHAVEADPLFVLDEAAAAPRVREFFSEVRRAHVPALIRQRYGAARAALAGKRYAEAEAGFAAVCTLVDAVRPTLGDEEAALGDLRDLAQGFLDLSRESLAAEARREAEAREAGEAAKPAESRDASQPPETGQAAPETSQSAPATSAPSPSDARPAQTAAAGASGEADTVPPVPLAQQLPPLQRMPGIVPGQVYRGVIEIDIDAEGLVTAARLLTSIHPVYDVRLLDAVRRWRYRPATRQGVAVPYTRRVNIEVEPLE